MQVNHSHAIGVVILASVSVLNFPIKSQSGDVAKAAGRVLLVKRTSAGFDRYTNGPDGLMQQWLRDHFWRMIVYSPYFDQRTSWYPNAWIYVDSYAIYKNSSDGKNLADIHPDWVLRDVHNSRLYIPWGCDPGRHTCSQYAADFSNPGFRQWWVDKAKALLARGKYKGLWIDDVNFDWRISDGNGAAASPIDPHTGRAMSIEAWRRYFAEFLEKVRRDLPRVEIAVNSIWYAGGAARDLDEYVQRQIAASDIITIEHGVNDRGLTGGDGVWSLNALLAYIDRINRAGKRVVIGGLGGDDPNDLAAVEYTIACYFLVSNGSNAVGDFGMALTPYKWWPGLDVNLGAPLAARFMWNGLLRRDFAAGTVLVNSPQGRIVTVAPPKPLKHVDGRPANSIALGSAQGVILLEASQPAAKTSPPKAF